MSLSQCISVCTLILFSLSASANISININKKLNNQLNHESFREQLASNDIVFVGGEHDEANEEYVKNLALEIKRLDPNYNCMTWEESEMHAENMLKAHLDWDQFVDNFYVIDYRVGKVFSSVFGFHPNPRQIIPKNIKPLVEAGIKNIPIDHSYTDLKWLTEFKSTLEYPEESDIYWKNYVRLILNERNQHMSQKIKELKQSSICKKIIVSIGESHLINNPYAHKINYSTPSLQSYLNDFNNLIIKVNTEDSRLVKPQVHEKFNGEQIKKFLKPIINQHTKRWIDQIHSVNILEDQAVPPQRRHSMYMHDIELQKGVQILIDRKDITTNTLVLSDTGHDLPIAGQIASLEQFRVLHAFHFPKYFKYDEGNQERIYPQLQEWANYIFKKQSVWKHTKSPNLIFIGLEGHRKDYNDLIKNPISTEWLPNNQELRALGIKKVVYLYERHPDFKEVKPMNDIQKYLNQLELPVKLLGTDCRRKPYC